MNDDIEQELNSEIKKALKFYVGRPSIYIDTVVWFIPLCYNLTLRINKFPEPNGQSLRNYIHQYIINHKLDFNETTFYALLSVHNRSTIVINDHFFERQLQ